MRSKKFDILKTFDIFNSETANILKEKLIKLVYVEAENFFINKSSIITEINNDNKAYITVLNNHKVFNLLNKCLKKYNDKNNEN